jgi:hypothetical protein
LIMCCALYSTPAFSDALRYSKGRSSAVGPNPPRKMTVPWSIAARNSAAIHRDRHAGLSSRDTMPVIFITSEYLCPDFPLRISLQWIFLLLSSLYALHGITHAYLIFLSAHMMLTAEG